MRENAGFLKSSLAHVVNGDRLGDVDDLHVGAPSPKNPHSPGPRQFEMDAEVTPFSAFWIDGHT